MVEYVARALTVSLGIRSELDRTSVIRVHDSFTDHAIIFVKRQLERGSAFGSDLNFSRCK
ncbi:hypothetical protein DPMN_189330 [Dreissena polymorpha]|uniref:Uncharacterized protein n=1 Tax=Dreissena polymorpha TaxID=45954 RepID=A0A9D4DSB9_DREPO|nr:hypothetical protein DPMN_189330 [Dreissena polymorpha]